jgi:hypothetical protein
MVFLDACGPPAPEWVNIVGCSIMALMVLFTVGLFVKLWWEAR